MPMAVLPKWKSRWPSASTATRRPSSDLMAGCLLLLGFFSGLSHARGGRERCVGLLCRGPAGAWLQRLTPNVVDPLKGRGSSQSDQENENRNKDTQQQAEAENNDPLGSRQKAHLTLQTQSLSPSTGVTDHERSDQERQQENNGSRIVVNGVGVGQSDDNGRLAIAVQNRIKEGAKS